jgi:DUF2892 family protein
MFRHNVGGIDRVLRLTLGGILFVAGLFLLASKITPGVILAAVGVLALLTGIVRFCALYIPFGISTARPDEQPLNKGCDCAAWGKVVQDNGTAVEQPPSEEKCVAEAMTTARGPVATR